MGRFRSVNVKGNMLLTVGLMGVLLGYSDRAISGANHPFAKIVIPDPGQSCSYEFSPINFCDEKHMGAIEGAISDKKPNFNGTYILLTIIESAKDHEQSLVIIDVRTGVVYPAPMDFFSGKPKEDGSVGDFGKIDYGADSDQICIDGSIVAYRAEQDGKFCFHFRDGKFTGLDTAYTAH
jgi:hypothetical protein